MNWDFSELIRAVGGTHGDHAKSELRICLDSVAWKCDFYRYHSNESIRLLDDAAYMSRGVDPADSKVIAHAKSALMAASLDESSKSFIEGRMKSEAHLIAAAQAVHSLGDIIANAAYWATGLALNMNASKLAEVKLSSASKDPKVNESVKRKLTGLSELKEYRYLGAFVNVTKHRRLVPASTGADLSLVESERRGIRIQSFTYRHENFERKWGAEFLQEDMPKVMEHTVAIGHELEMLVGVQSAS